MDQQDLHRWEGRCIQEEPPACRAGCPLGVDGRAFALALADHDLAAARAILEKSMPLVGIVGRLCETPCEDFCLRKNLGGAIALGDLERYCLSAVSGRGKVLRLPARGQKVAVLGGGPSSLVAAFELSRKGYAVELFHLGSLAGGWLRHLPEERLPVAILEEELDGLRRLGVGLFPSDTLGFDLPAVSTAAAVYLGRDDDGIPPLLAGLAAPDPITFALELTGLFAGGITDQDHRHRFIVSVSQGREAAVSIDRHLQGASLTASRVLLRHGRTDLFTDTSTVATVLRLAASTPGRYTRSEAVAEAGRCLNCHCLQCVKHCAYLAEYGSYPKVYARRIYNNSAIVKGIHQYNRFINGCSLCGQCATLCPKGFSMAELCLHARRQMVREKRMPPSAHWFALNEMRAASSETAVVRHAPRQAVSQWLFFPGCQLAGIRAEQTLALYHHLLGICGETGFWLDCCAAPAHWAGREEELATMSAQRVETWRSMGSPPLIVACSTCRQIFAEHLPEIKTVSLWAYLAKNVLPVSPLPSLALALSDPCTSRHDQETRQAVRNLLAAIGQELAPMEMAGELTECCGYGGLMEGADPALARKVAEARVAQTEAPFLTYCAMCRDQLAKTGKEVLHLLDLLLPQCAHPADEPPASISTRRSGRKLLQRKILQLHGAEEHGDAAGDALNLVIPPAVAALLEERRILEEDIRHVLATTGNQAALFSHKTGGQRLASARRGEVTFWVSYRLVNDVHHIDRCWSHRMAIGKEETP